MTEKKIKIEGMSCQHCVMAIRKELAQLNVSVKRLEIGLAEVEFDETKLELKQIEQAIEEAGYKIVKE